jgi:hypothetical protein
MPKVKLTKLAEEYELPFKEALEVVHEKLPPDSLTGKGKNTWVSEAGQSIIKEGLFITEIMPKTYVGKVLKECPNPRYNYVYNKDIGKRVPVMIPRRYQGKMVGKNIHFEAVEDDTGVSYRYARV